MKYTGTITIEPIVQEKWIKTAIKLDGEQKPTQVITFPMHRDAETVDNIKAFKVSDRVILYGTKGPNPKTREIQIVVSKAFFADAKNKQSSVEPQYAIDPDVDFIVGGLSSYNQKKISMSEPREGRKQYYTDGDYYWYKDHPTLNEKTPTSF